MNSEKWDPELKNSHSKWSIPILKSNLQKAVRRMNLNEAIETGGGELKNFMIRNTRKNDLLMFANMANEGDFIDNSQIPFYIVLPAYITSELKTAFQIGFLLFLPSNHFQ